MMQVVYLQMMDLLSGFMDAKFSLDELIPL